MAKKKKKAKSQSAKQDDVPQIKIISVEEHFKRQHRHDFRIEAARDNDEAFRGVKEKYDDLMRLEEEKLKWERYVNCDKVPDVKSPSEIRTYLYKWLFEEWEMIKSFYSWILSIDERSILTQDMDVPDMTRAKLRANVPSRGKVCSYHVENAIKIINGIEEVLDVSEVNRFRAHEELAMVKNEVRNRIKSSIDNLSYLILNDIDGNMEMIDAKSDKYTIQTNPFNISFWGIRNVPCDFRKLDVPRLIIKLEAIDGVVTLPIATAFENMQMRGLHLKFDHRSAYATSFNLKVAQTDVRDIKLALVKEWNTRKQIESKKLQQMRDQRQHYEDELRIQEEEAKKAEANKNKKAKDAKPKKKPKKGKKAKALVEPPVVAPDTFLDVEDDFIEKDDMEHEMNMRQYHPDLLNLLPHEMNLREYVILGGVYEINFLEKPVQSLVGGCCFKRKNMPERLRYKHFQTTTTESQMSQLDSNDTATKDSRLELVKEPKREIPYQKLVEISLKLPSYLCRWAIPKTCRWSSKTDETRDEIEEDKLETTRHIAEGGHQMPIVTKDMCLGTMEARKNLHYVIKNQILPRMDSLHKFPDEIAEEKELLKAMNIQRERLRKEAEMDDDLLGGVNNQMARASKASARQEVVSVNSTPPASLFPRPRIIERLKISSKEFLGDKSSEELNNLSGEDRKLLSEYLEELDKLAEARKPQMNTWWALIRHISKTKLPMELKSHDIEGHGAAGKKRTSERHSRKSAKESKGRVTGSKTAATRSASKMSGISLKSMVSLNQEPTSTSLSEIKEVQMLTDEEEAYSIMKGNWSTEWVFKEDFNEEHSEMTFLTDRLGIFGFAFKRYLHFPFEDWAIYPDKKKRETVILEIRSPYTSFFVNIEPAGYTVSVMNGMQKHIALLDPICDLRKFKRQMEMLGLNIFAKKDTTVYLDGISAKHAPLEYHVYQTITQFCLAHKFGRSKWNWLAHRRVLLMKFGSPLHRSFEMDTIQMTPEESHFCLVSEACTPLDKTVLDYTPTPKNIRFEPNLRSLLMSHSSTQRARNAKVEYLTYCLLKSVQPLTYCK